MAPSSFASLLANNNNHEKKEDRNDDVSASASSACAGSRSSLGVATGNGGDCCGCGDGCADDDDIEKKSLLKSPSSSTTATAGSTSSRGSTTIQQLPTALLRSITGRAFRRTFMQKKRVLRHKRLLLSFQMALIITSAYLLVHYSLTTGTLLLDQATLHEKERVQAVVSAEFESFVVTKPTKPAKPTTAGTQDDQSNNTTTANADDLNNTNVVTDSSLTDNEEQQLRESEVEPTLDEEDAGSSVAATTTMVTRTKIILLAYPNAGATYTLQLLRKLITSANKQQQLYSLAKTSRVQALVNKIEDDQQQPTTPDKSQTDERYSVIHLLRDPFDIVVSGFRKDLAAAAAEKNDERSSNNNSNRYEEGSDHTVSAFRSYCQQKQRQADRQQRQQKHRRIIPINNTVIADISPSMEDAGQLLTNPSTTNNNSSTSGRLCMSEFEAYLDWHNRAFHLTREMNLDPYVLYYEDFAVNGGADPGHQFFDRTVQDLAAYLLLREDSNSRSQHRASNNGTEEKTGGGRIINMEPLSSDLIHHREFFTREEQITIQTLTQRLASEETWGHLQRYFPALS